MAKKYEKQVPVGPLISWSLIGPVPKLSGPVFSGVFGRSSATTKDRLSVREGSAKTPLGALYYRGLRELYACASTPGMQLQVVDSKELVDPQLFAALTALRAGNSQKAPLRAWMSTASSVNQRELVGLLRQLLNLKPSSSQKQQDICVDAFRFMARAGAFEKHANEMKVCTPWLEATLGALLASTKRAGMAPSTFWKLNRDMVEKLLPAAAVDKILAVQDGEGWEARHGIKNKTLLKFSGT